MKKRMETPGHYELLTGIRIPLGRLTRAEKQFLRAARKKFLTRPGWTPFANWWMHELRRAGLTMKSVAYRISQDLEGRLGLAQGRVAPPDYRDYLLDLIELRYGSRYRFCKVHKIDPGHLSRVIHEESDLSLKSLGGILEALGAVLVLQEKKVLRHQASPAQASKSLAGVR